MIENLTQEYIIRVSEDKLEAYITVMRNDERISLSEIQKQLLKNNVKYGILINNVKDILKNQKFDKEILIAKGLKPGQSEPAYLEYLISEEIEKSPQVDEDGNADHKDINIVKQVTKDTALIRKHPFLPGKNGMNVSNEIISAEEADDVKLPIGENTTISEIDEHLCVAASDGYLIKNSNGSFSVKPLLKIKEDVDFSTGNIDFKGSVVINGDVKAGFSVKATKDVTINGVIEDAVVESGGTVECAKGIIGRNQGKIIAQKDVRIGYIENQSVVAEGNIYVKHEVINGTLEAGNSIRSEKGKIIGGSVTAGSMIDASEIGTKEGTQTEISVGVNNFVAKKLQETQEKIQKLKAREKVLSENVMALAMKKVEDDGFTQEMEQELTNLKKEKELIPAWIAEQEKIISDIDYELSELLKSKIIIRNKLYQNVKCTLNDYTVITKETYTNVKVLLEDDQIKFERV